MSNTTLRQLFAIEESSQKQTNIFKQVLKKDEETTEENIAFLVGYRTQLQTEVEKLLDTDVSVLGADNLELLKAALKSANTQVALLTQAISGEEIKKNVKVFRDLGTFDFDAGIIVDYQPEEVVAEEAAPIEEVAPIEEPTEETETEEAN